MKIQAEEYIYHLSIYLCYDQVGSNCVQINLKNRVKPASN